MSQRVVYFNGRYVPESEARVSIFDSALMYGDMAFEMTRTFNQQPFQLRAHLDRLYGSLKLLEIDCGLTRDELEAITRDTLTRNLSTEPADVEWQIMHNVSRGPLEPYRSLFPEGQRPTITVNCFPLITHIGRFATLYRSGVHVIVSPQRAMPADLIDPRIKTRSRLHAQLALLHSRRQGPGRWPVLLDARGQLTEGPNWNIFVVKQGELLTPKTGTVLSGVSRTITLELARAAGIPVREQPLDVQAARDADEIFCTATSFCLIHAATFDGQTIGAGSPGPVVRQLTDGWKRYTGVDFIAQAELYASRIDAWEASQSL